MPIIFPIVTAESSDLPLSLLFEGGTALTFSAGHRHSGAIAFGGGTALTLDPGVTILESVLFAGSTIMTARGGAQQQGAIAFLGNTALGLTGRLNDEANVFGVLNLNGSTAITISGRLVQQAALVFESISQLTINANVEEQADIGLMFYIDILGSAVLEAQEDETNIRRYTGRALIGGQPIEIKRAELDAPENTLGMSLSLILAKPLPDQIGLETRVDFQIGIWADGDYQYATFMKEGRLSARQHAVKNVKETIPADEVVVSLVDVIADRWNRAPRAPIFLFDPQKVPTPSESQIADQRIEKEDGSYIFPIYVPITNMSLRDVLHEAYVEGTGFDEVITNIPDFPVREVAFTLEGGYDAGVRPLLELFSPIFFADQSNRLFIMDPDYAMPGSMVAQDQSLWKTRQISDSMPQRELVNGLLIRMQGATGGEYFTERLEQETNSAGLFGTPSFTETTLTRRIREYRNTAAPAIIVREEVVEEEQETIDWEFNVLERAIKINKFDVLGRKTGYSMTTDRRLPDVGADGDYALLQNVLSTQQLITYKTNPLDPNQDIQDRVTTVESGLILVDEGFEYLGNPFKIPLTDAHATGMIDPTAEQHTEHADIRTTTEQLRVRGQQVDIEVTVINHVSNAPSKNSTTSRPGAVTIDRREQTATRTVLITIPDTDDESRRLRTLNAGELPADLAISLGQRKLRRLNDPPKELSLERAYIDLSIRRGTILNVVGRGGSLGKYIVTGFTITVEEAPQRGVTAMTTLRARELKDG